MMKTFLILLLLAAGPAMSQTTEESFSVPPPPPPPPPVEEIFSVVEEYPEYPGGYPAMMEFFKKNLHYPESAIENNIEGKCFVKFVVDKDGRIFDIRIVRGVPGCPECDREAIRAVKLMPKWKPAKNNGQIVRCYFNLPINFVKQ